jgi:predicted Zn-dependent protease
MRFLNRLSTRFVWIAGFVVCISAGILSCQSIPGTGKKSLVLLTRSQELQMGENAWAEIKKKEKRSTNLRATQILERVGQRVSAQAAIADFKWEFLLIESEQKNAFCLPGGKVAFYTGILPVLENEAAMAVVMGHEVAHAVARHGAQRVSQGLLTQFGLAVLDLAVLQDSQYRSAILGGLGLGAQVGVLLPFSRSHESEADVLGLRYAAAAGYDPDEAARFWQRFSKSGGAKPPEFLSTHPSDGTRIQNLKRLAGDLQAVYANSPRYALGERL